MLKVDADRDHERRVWVRGGQAAWDLPQDRKDCRVDQQSDLLSYSLERMINHYTLKINSRRLMIYNKTWTPAGLTVRSAGGFLRENKGLK